MNYIALTRRCSASIAELKGKSVQIRRGPATVCERKAHQVTEAKMLWEDAPPTDHKPGDLPTCETPATLRG
jgi:hypothetical protein